MHILVATYQSGQNRANPRQHWLSSDLPGYFTRNIRYSAQHIPDARFLGFDRGGHLLLGHGAEVVAAVEALIRTAPAR
jgi:hypothetical protein